MNTLKLDSQGIDVLFLQSRLGIITDGSFGVKTDAAVREYQANHGLLVDGVVGNKTWSTFITPSLTQEDYKNAADFLGCDIASIKAIKTVESNGKGFVNMVRPTILFEGHIFYKHVHNAWFYAMEYGDICYKKWDKKKYKGGNGEYDRLSKAWDIDKTAAMKSASMGLFQILGENYSLCGCKNVNEMWAQACLGEKEQLNQVCVFLKNTGIDLYLKKHDWEQVARRYNGPSYAQNNYDTKLKAAYEKYKA